MPSKKLSAPSPTTQSMVVDDKAESPGHSAPGAKIGQVGVAREMRGVVPIDEVMRFLLAPHTVDAKSTSHTVATATALLVEAIARQLVAVVPQALSAVPREAGEEKSARDHPRRFAAAGFIFDLDEGLALAVDGSRPNKKLRLAILELLRFLWARPSRQATRSEIAFHLGRHGGYGGTAENVRKVVDRFRREFGLGADDVVRGLREEDGGFVLCPEEPQVPKVPL